MACIASPRPRGRAVRKSKQSSLPRILNRITWALDRTSCLTDAAAFCEAARGPSSSTGAPVEQARQGSNLQPPAREPTPRNAGVAAFGGFQGLGSESTTPALLDNAGVDTNPGSEEEPPGPTRVSRRNDPRGRPASRCEGRHPLGSIAGPAAGDYADNTE